MSKGDLAESTLAIRAFVQKVSAVSLSDPHFQAKITQVAEEAMDFPLLFVFAELLDMPQIKNAPASVQEKIKLFAYRTFRDYKAESAKYGPLTVNQINKLRQLTIISLSEKSRIIPYTLLLHELDVPDVRQLEDLVMTSIYQGIISAKMDQAAAHLEVHSAIGRDILPGPSGAPDLSAIRATLAHWVETSDKLLATIDERVNFTSVAATDSRNRSEDFETKLKTAKETVKVAIDAGAMSAGPMGGAQRMMMMGSGMEDFVGPDMFDKRHKYPKHGGSRHRF
ncbi:COP9 signalosome complex subunit 7b [Pelomyxa schiedti]|nr:COP9 signalosome complex subunit 7b [Pelomyxa schiedti]